ncbi:MAG TPA: FAD-binding oxidoreductase [Alphaproteobacteria bacterium]|jgi:FAD/FMN-containing dehydrogenase|nr:FAD-binding oxidoreductase [Alphaproteobacteria bacterium]
MDPHAALAAIRQVVGAKGMIEEPSEIAPHINDQRDLFHGSTLAVVRPTSTTEVSDVVRIAADARLPIVPQGGNTGLVGGSVPPAGAQGIVLSLGRMNRVRAIDAVNNTMTVEAGCVLKDLQDKAREAGRLFPLSLGAEGSCMIGGNLSTNAGGVGVLRYGNARELLLGLEVVLADGRVWNGLRGLRKDNTGYDLKHLFVGAEGTLGVITAAVLKLFPLPASRETAFVAVPDVRSALLLLNEARAASGDAVSAFELVPRLGVELVTKHFGTPTPLATQSPWYVLIELTSPESGDGLRQRLEGFLETALESGRILDATIAASEAQRRTLWHLREVLPESQTREGGSIKHDVSVPVSRIPDFIAKGTAAIEAALPGARVFAFGHMGDGNIHFNVSQPVGADKGTFLKEWERLNRVVHDIVAALGGSFSAEHGIGVLKKGELRRYRSPLELELMQRIKTAFDPAGIMNPGKIL